MYANNEVKMLYLAHPCTASMSTAATLCNDCGFEKVQRSDHHGRLWDYGYSGPVTRDNRSGWIVFTAVRNHWDTAVSWRFRKEYLREITDPWGAELWQLLLENNYWINQDRMWGLHTDVDVVVRYESLEQQLRAVLAKRGLSFSNLDNKNSTPGRGRANYRDYFTSSGRDYIGSRFAQEIDRFGYTFEEN